MISRSILERSCLAAVALSTVALCACSSEPAPGASPGGEPVAADSATYYRDVYPILQTKCASCHVSGGIAPFAFDDPATVQSFAGLIHATTTDQTMPPWPPTDLSPAIRDARLLSAEEIQVLADWEVAGAPLGDPAEKPEGLAPAVFPLTHPDIVAGMSAPYAPDPSLSDDYRCFVVDLNIPEPREMLGFRVLPGNAKVVHHAIISLYRKSDLAELEAIDAETPETGWPCFAGAVPEGSGILPAGKVGSWTPGNDGQVMYPGTATPIPADVVAVMSIHYNTANGFDPDQTRMEMYFAPPESADALIPLKGSRLVSRDIFIPAGAPETKVTAETAIKDGAAKDPFTDGEGFIVGASAHGHYLLTQHRITLNKGTPAEQVILDLDWNFHWQGSYLFESPIPVKSTDVLTMECTYDNSPEHRAEVGLDPMGADVTWGEETTDEMCMGGVQVIDQLPAE